MIFQLSNNPPSPTAFKVLYDTTGWGPISRNQTFYRESLRGSWVSRTVLVDGQLVGYGRVISDGKLHAFITEMIILPEYQDQGIGGAIIDSLVSHCLSHGITDIQLFCAQDKSGFYEKHKFKRRPEDAPGMEYSDSI